jgi:clan AA aspartic protease (TIGR02281 family)
VERSRRTEVHAEECRDLSFERTGTPRATGTGASFAGSRINECEGRYTFLRMHSKMSDISSAVLLAMLLFCGAAYSESIPLVHEHGTLQVPVVINGQSLFNFTIDSGATDVSIPANIFFALTRAGTVSPQDFLDKRAYKLADGSTEFSQRFRIRSLRVGSLELRDVIASVVPSKGSLLLGQSFLSRLSSWSIDNERQVLVLAEIASPRSALIVPRAGKNGGNGWERLSDLHDPKGVLFLNTASFQTNGNLRWFSEKHVFPPHTAKWLGKWVSYSVDHWEFDCTDKRAKLDARSDIYEDGTLWVADAPLLSSTAWHSVEGDAWKEGEMKLLCERVRPDTFSTR